MPVYHDIRDNENPCSFDGYTFEYTEDKMYVSGYVFYKIVFRKDGLVHRTDGPAIIKGSTLQSNTVGEYAVAGVSIPPNILDNLLSRPIQEMPLYINDEVLKLAAADRMNKDKTTMVSKTNRVLLRKLKKICNVKG
jgi:hypothetical protein